MQLWHDEVESDKATLESLITNASEKDNDYKHLNNDNLESKLIVPHKYQLVVSVLTKKYSASMSKDSDTQKFLREKAHKRFETSDTISHN